MAHHETLSGDRPRLLERDGELTTLQQVLDAAAMRQGQMLAIVGPAGIGKSSLLAAARDEADRAQFRLLTASGSMLERSFPYGLCRQLFEPVVMSADEPERTALLHGAASIAAPLLLEPPTGTDVDEGDAVSGPESGSHLLHSRRMEAFARLHGLYWLAVNLAESAPLLIAVDDAHNADVQSLHFLHYLARRLDGLPIAAVVVTREGETDPEEDVVHSLLVAPTVGVLRPAALSEVATAALVRKMLRAEPEGDFTAACRAATGGNPFYLRELLRALQSSGTAPVGRNSQRVRGVGPPAISRDVLGRVAHLGPGCVALVRALAVLGEPEDLAAVAEVAGLSAGEAATAADALCRAEILSDWLPPRFCHPIMQAAIYEDIPPLSRADCHHRAALLLDSRSAGASAVGVHLLNTQPGHDRWTLDRLREAAALALARGANNAAIEYLRRGLLESPDSAERFELMSPLGQALAAMGDPEGVDVMRASLADAPDPAARAQVAIPLASTLVYIGRAEEAVVLLESTLNDLDDTHANQQLAAQLTGLLCVIGVTDLAARQHLRERLARTVEHFRKIPEETAEPLLPALAVELINTGTPAAEAAALAERALRTGDVLHGGLTHSPLPYVAAYVLISADQPRLAETRLNEAAQRAKHSGAIGHIPIMSTARSLARLRRGDLRGAQADAELCLRVLTEQRPEVFSPIAFSTLVTADVERGELQHAREVLTRPVVPHFDPEGVLTQPLFESRGRLRFAEGDYDNCLRELRHCREWSDAWGEQSGSWPVQWRSAMALCELRRGNTTQAHTLAEEDVELAQRFGAARPLGRALTALGLCQGGVEGIATLREAVEALSRSDDRLEHARALVELGAALRRRGRRTAAREPLHAAMKMSRDCGATTLTERAYDELRAAGARPHKILGSGVDALTASELRVARLAATGVTNREVAQSLFVTPKTVEVHLSHAYQKLGITSRSELATALDADHSQQR